jgi:hypothetical protein
MRDGSWAGDSLLEDKFFSQRSLFEFLVGEFVDPAAEAAAGTLSLSLSLSLRLSLSLYLSLSVSLSLSLSLSMV